MDDVDHDSLQAISARTTRAMPSRWRALAFLPLLLLAASASALEIPAGPEAHLHATFQRDLSAWLAKRVEAPLRAALPPAGHARIGEIIALVAEPSARPSPALLAAVRDLRGSSMDVDPVAGIAYALVEGRAIGPTGWTMVLMRTGADRLAQEHRLPEWRLLAEMGALGVVASWNDPASIGDLRERSLKTLEELLSAPRDESAERYLWWLWQRAETQRYQGTASVERVVVSARSVHSDATWLGRMLGTSLKQLQSYAIRGEARLTAQQAIVDGFASAHEMHPDRPEAALEILRLRTRDRIDDDGDDDETWFLRAVTAEFDNAEAYRLMTSGRLANCPTCRGRFARACLATGRFDTIVPLAYLAANGFSTENAWAGNRGGTDLRWRQGQRRKDVDQLIAGYRAGALGGDPRLRLLEAELLLLEGEPARASDALKAVPADIDLQDTSLLVQLTRFGRPLALVREEADARAQAGDALARAESVYAGGDINGGLAALASLIDGGATGAVRSFALRYGAAMYVQQSPAIIHDPSPLPRAATFGQPQAVTWLLDRHEPVDAVDREGCTALHRATERGAVELIQLLLTRGANLEAADQKGRTALHLVAGLTNIPQGYPPAMIAQMAPQSLKTLQALLDKGAKANARDHEQLTPVHYALRRQWVEGVTALVDAGGLAGLSTAETAALRKEAEASPAGVAIVSALENATKKAGDF